MTSAFRQGWSDARAGLGARYPLAAAVAALLFIASAGVLEGGASHGPGGTKQVEQSLLQGVSFGLALPLFCWSLLARLDTGLDALMAAAWARHGGNRRVYALGRLSFPVSLAGGLALIGGAFAVALTLASASVTSVGAAPHVPPSEAVLIGAALLAASSYGAAFGLAHLVAGGWGRLSFLFADWLLGSSTGLWALPWPRAHVRALLGGDAVLGLSASQSAECLLSLSLLCALVYARRVPR